MSSALWAALALLQASQAASEGDSCHKLHAVAKAGDIDTSKLFDELELDVPDQLHRKRMQSVERMTTAVREADRLGCDWVLRNDETGQIGFRSARTWKGRSDYIVWVKRG